MATLFENCCICYLRHVSKLSVVWCSDCDEGLCLDCKEHHGLSKATRNHTTVLIAEYHMLPSFIANIKLNCDGHDEKYQLFCNVHNELLCRKCVISANHRECKEILLVEDVVQNAKTSVAFTEITSSLVELKENLSRILADRQKNVSSLSASKKKFESEISAIRQTINYNLDKMQDNFVAELNKSVENSTKQIQSFIASLKKTQSLVEEWIENVESIKEHATDMQTFLGITQLETKLNKTENDIQSWIEDQQLAHVEVICQFNDLLQNISKETPTFGKVGINALPCKLLLKRRKESQAQLISVNVNPTMSVDNITLKLKTKINTTALNVSGCCILPCGKLVVSNFNPSFLILFSPGGKFEKKITNMMPNIHDVTCVDNETVAVISSTKRNIELVSLKLGKTFRSISTTHPSYGVTYSEGNFIVSLENKLQEIRLKNNEKNYIRSGEVSTFFASLGNTLYSVNGYTNTIVCHNRNGDILWTFTDEMVLTGPRGITVDEHGNSFVAGLDSKNVIAIDSGGKQYKTLLSETDLIGSPWALCYNSKFKSLFVVNEKDGQAFLYTVNYAF
ncbi:uncharacterized protein LOC127706831 [Mytilus californianus]|uniref:uncharacterized protein LOC127706831 n=1 Tax=Mytilus californianus TaxID=6549 RepID=UPI0022472EAF|nr:uncharacterized protein LOC127706831 [Mytilus californianus]